METRAFGKMYILQLQDLYSAGKQIVDSYPKLLKIAKSKELKHILKEFNEKNKAQVLEIENLLKSHSNFNQLADNCDIVEALLEEAEEWIEVTNNSSLIDAGLILLSKKINHYRFAIIESIISYSRILGKEDISEKFNIYLKEAYLMNSKFDEILEEAGSILIK